jgi:polysaccharide deacetylase 2 family uncharacterized protein YibQ
MKKAASNALLTVVLLVAAGFAFYRFYYTPRVERSEAAIKKAVDSFVTKQILVDPLLIISKKENGVYDLTARMPARYTVETLKNEIKGGITGVERATVDFGEVETDRTTSVTASIESPFKLVCKLRFIRDKRPKIAIILDDWGYADRNFSYLASIKDVFSISVLPGLKYSSMAAEEAFKYKKGILLHLPMQPEKKVPMEKITIMANMNKPQIVSIVDRQITEIPHFTGVNNHEGSLVTAKKEIITPVLEVLKDRNLFFIDSMTTPKTVAYKIAQELGMRWAKRDVFIDNKKEAAYNEEQINKLAKLAKSRGWAIGIGHDDPVTLATLSRMMPKLAEEGFEFVYPAELLQ